MGPNERGEIPPRVMCRVALDVFVSSERVLGQTRTAPLFIRGKKSAPAIASEVEKEGPSRTGRGLPSCHWGSDEPSALVTHRLC